jgi:hypothetical protein
MSKIKINSINPTQQANVITKCRQWGAAARDGDYGPVPGKTGVVINTQLGANKPALQLSDVNFTPTKNPYTDVYSYKDFMNLEDCPWDAPTSKINLAKATPEVRIEKEVHLIRVPTEVGICAQETLQVTSCDVLVQEAIAWETQGLPFLEKQGVNITYHEGEAYILNVKKNTSKKLTAKSAAKRAKNAILAGDYDAPFAVFARHFNLVDNAVMAKVIKD